MEWGLGVIGGGLELLEMRPHRCEMISPAFFPPTLTFSPPVEERRVQVDQRLTNSLKYPEQQPVANIIQENSRPRLDILRGQLHVPRQAEDTLGEGFAERDCVGAEDETGGGEDGPALMLLGGDVDAVEVVLWHWFRHR